MGESSRLVELAVAILPALLGCGAVYGIFQTKIDRLERDVDDLNSRLDQQSKEFVPHPHFEAVIRPLQAAMGEIERDIKKILQLLVNKKPHGRVDD